MRYGGTNPYTTYRDPYNVFPFFDDFSGTSLDTSKWVVKNPLSGSATGGVTVANGYVEIYSGSSSATAIVSKASFRMPFAVEARWAWVQGAEAWFAVTHVSGGSDSDWLRFGYTSNTFYYQKRVSGTITTIQSISRTPPANWARVSIIWNSNSYYYENGAQVNTATAQDRYTPGTALYLEIFTWNGGRMRVDWVAVRPYVNPEPYVSLFTHPYLGHVSNPVQAQLSVPLQKPFTANIDIPISTSLTVPLQKVFTTSITPLTTTLEVPLQKAFIANIDTPIATTLEVPKRYDVVSNINQPIIADLLAYKQANVIIQINPQYVYLYPGNSTTVSVSVKYASSYPVNINVGELPAGIAVTPSSVTASSTDTFSFTISVDSSATPGYYALPLNVVSSDYSGTEYIRLAVLSPNWLNPWYGRAPYIIHSFLTQPSPYIIRLTLVRSEGRSSGTTIYCPYAKPDFSDIRVTGSDGQTILPFFVIPQTSTTATLVVGIPNIGANPGGAVIYIYYGNPNANKYVPSDPSIKVYDDFEGATSGTLYGQAQLVPSSGIVKLTTASSNQLGYVVYNKAPGRYVYAVLRFKTYGGNGADAIWLGLWDNTYQNTQEDVVAGGYHITFDEYQDRIAFTKSTQGNNGNPISSYGTTDIDNSNWHIGEALIYVSGNSVVAYVWYDGRLVISGATDTSPQSNALNNLGLIILGGRTDNSYNNHDVDFLYVMGFESAGSPGIVTTNVFDETSANTPWPSGTLTLNVMERLGIHHDHVNASIAVSSLQVPYIDTIPPSLLYFTLGDDTPLRYWICSRDNGQLVVAVEIPNVEPYSVKAVTMRYGVNSPYPSYYMGAGYCGIQSSLISNSTWVQVNNFDKWYAPRYTTSTAITSVTISSNSISVLSGTSTGTYSVPSLTSYGMLYGVLLSASESGTTTTYGISAKLMNGSTLTLYITTCNSNGPEVMVFRDGVLVSSVELGCGSKNIALVAVRNPSYSTTPNYVISLTSPITRITITPVSGSSGNSALSMYVYGALFTTPVEVIQNVPTASVEKVVPITLFNNDKIDYPNGVVALAYLPPSLIDWSAMVPSSIYVTDDYGNILDFYIAGFSLTDQKVLLAVKLPYILGYEFHNIYVHYGGSETYSQNRNIELPAYTTVSRIGPETIPFTPPEGWSFVYVVKIANTGSSTVSNPVVDVVLEPVFDFRFVRVDGVDIMVVDQYGRSVPFTLVEWNSFNNHGKIRIQFPGSIPAGGSVRVYILAGNYNVQSTASQSLPSPTSSVSGTLLMKKAVMPFAYVLNPPDLASSLCFSWAVISPNAGSQTQFRINIADDPYFNNVIYTAQGDGEKSICITLDIPKTKLYFAGVVITTDKGVTSTTWMRKALFLTGASPFLTPPSNVNVLNTYTVINPMPTPLSMHVVKIPIPNTVADPTAIAFVGEIPVVKSTPTVVVSNLRLTYTYTYSNGVLTQGSSTGGKNVIIQGLPPSSYVEIYDLNRYSGRLTYVGFADTSGKLTIESYNIPLPIDGSPRTFAIAIYSGGVQYETALLPFIVGYGEDGVRYTWVVIPYIAPNGKFTIKMISNVGQWQYGLDDVFDRDVIYVATWSNLYGHPNTGSELDQMFSDSKSYRLSNWFGAGFVTSVYDSSTSNNNPFGSGDLYIKEYVALVVPKISGSWGFATDSDDASHIAITSLGNGVRSVVASWYGIHGLSEGWSHSGTISLNAGSQYMVIYRQEDGSGGDAARMAVMYPGSSSWQVFSVSMYQLDIYGVRTPPYDFIVIDNSQSLAPFVYRSSSGFTNGLSVVIYNPSQTPVFDVVVPIELDPKAYGLTATMPNSIRVEGTVFAPSDIVGVAYASLTPGTAYQYVNGVISQSGSANSNAVVILGLPANSLVYIHDGLQRYVLGIADSGGKLTTTLYKPVSGALIIVSGSMQKGVLPYVIENNANAIKIYVRFLVLWPGSNPATLYIGSFGDDNAIYGYDKVFQIYVNPATASVKCLSIPGYSNLNSLTQTLTSSSQVWCRLPYALPNIGNWSVKTSLTYTSQTGTDSIVGVLPSYPTSLSVVGIHSAVYSYSISQTLKLYYNRLNGYNGGDTSTLYTLPADTPVPTSIEVITGTQYVVKVYISSWVSYPAVVAQYTPTNVGNYVFPAVVLNSGSISINSVYIARVAPSVSVAVAPTQAPLVSKPIMPILFGSSISVSLMNPNAFPVYDVVVPITLTSNDIDFAKIHNNGADIRVAMNAPAIDPTTISIASGTLQPGKKYVLQDGVFTATTSISRSDVAELDVKPYTALFINFHGKVIPVAYDYDGDGVIHLKLNGQLTAAFITAKFTVSARALPYYIASFVPDDRIIIYVRVPYIPPQTTATLFIYYDSPSLSVDTELHGVDKVFLFGDVLDYPSGRVSYDQSYGTLFPFFTPRNSYAYVETKNYLELYAEALVNMPPSKFASVVIPLPLYELATISDGFAVSTQAYSSSISKFLIGFASRYTEVAGVPTGSYGVLYHSGTNTVGIYSVTDSLVNTLLGDIFQLSSKPVITYTLLASGSAVLTIDGTTVSSVSSTSLQMLPTGISAASETGSTWKLYWLGVHRVVGAPVVVEGVYSIKDDVVEADLTKWEKIVPVQISNPSNYDLYDYQLRITIYPSTLSLSSLPSNIVSLVRFVATYPVATGDILTTFTVSLNPGSKYTLTSEGLVPEGIVNNPYLVKIKTKYSDGIVVGVFKDGKLLAVGRDYDRDGYVELETASTLSNVVVAVVRGTYKDIYLPYWCEGISFASATCWVRVPYIPVGDSFNVKLLYSSSGYTPESIIYGAKKVFIFYDDFDSGDISSWTIYGYQYGSVDLTTMAYQGAYSLHVRDLSTGGTTSVAKKVSIPTPFILSMYVMFDNGANPAYPMNWDAVDVNGNVASASWGSIVSNRMLGYKGAIYYSSGGQYGYTARIYDNTWYKLEVAWDPANRRHMTFLNGVMVGADRDYLDNGVTASYFTTIKITASSASATNGIYVDKVIVRKFAYPEPTAITADYAANNEPPYKEASENVMAGNALPIDIVSSWSDTFYDKAVRIEIPSSIADISIISDTSRVRFVAYYVVPVRTKYITSVNLNGGGMYSVSDDKIVKTGSASNGIAVSGLSPNEAVLLIIPGSYTILAYDYDGDGAVFIPLSNYRVLNARYAGYIALVEVRTAYVLLPYYQGYKDATKVVYWVRVPYITGSYGNTRIFMYYSSQFGPDTDIYGLNKVFAKGLVYVSGYLVQGGTAPSSSADMDNLFNSFNYNYFIGGAFVEQILHPYNPVSATDAYATYYFAVIVPKYSGQHYFGTDSDDASDVLIYDCGMVSGSVVVSWYGSHRPNMNWITTAPATLNALTPYVLIYRQVDVGEYQLSALGLGSAGDVKEFTNFYWASVLNSVYSTPTILQEPLVFVGGRSGYGGINSYVIQWVGSNEYPPFMWFTTTTNVLLRINGNRLSYGPGSHVITFQPGAVKIEVYDSGNWRILAMGTATYVSASPKFVVTDVYINGTVVGYLDIGGTPYPVVSGYIIEEGVGTLDVKSYSTVVIKLDEERVNVGIRLNTLVGREASVTVPVVTFGKDEGIFKVVVSSSSTFSGFIYRLNDNLIVFQGVTNIKGYIDVAGLGLNPMLTYVAVGDKVYKLLDVWRASTLWVEVK